MTQILDGKIVRDKIAQKLKTQISFSRENGTKLRSQPKLVIIQIGNLPQSNTYIAQKIKFGQKIGAIVEHTKFPENVGQQELISKLYSLNASPIVHGIIVQLPIPDHLDKDELINTIDPLKDIDGQTSTNLKMLWGNKEGYIPATTKGILTLLDYYKIPIEAKKVVVVGRSSLVGKPTALALLNSDATVTIAHSKTKNLKVITKSADILIVAVGKPKLITKDYVTKGQTIIDVGINVIEGPKLTSKAKPENEPLTSRLTGDVDFDQVSKVVKAISPVPGGCGPMTVASLFENLLTAYKRQTQ